MQFKYLGVLDESIADFYGLEEHKNKPIVVYNDRINHVKQNHLKDFGSVNDIMLSYNNLEKIIKKPDFTFIIQKQKV